MMIRNPSSGKFAMMYFESSNDFYTNNKMDDITPELYKEVLKYKKQGDNYLTQPIDLSNYMHEFNQQAA